MLLFVNKYGQIMEIPISDDNRYLSEMESVIDEQTGLRR